MGRVAIDIYRRSANIVYALIEAEGGGGGRGGGGGGGRAGGGGAAAGGGGRAGGAEAPAGAPPSPGSGLYRSDDGGNTWRLANGTNPRPMYFSQVRVDPNNPDRVYMGGVGLHMTNDGGRSMATDAALVIHDDIHAIWINPNNTEHVLIGGDGGVAVSYDASRTWVQLPNLPLALYYHVSVDMEMPYNICGGLQDNYNWCGPSATRFTGGIKNSDFFQVQGGDGFVVLTDPRDPRIVYSESQDGNISRKNTVTGESRSIRPSTANVTAGLEEKPEAFRFNWDTPMVFSTHEPGTLLVGRQPRVPLERSRRLVDGDQPRPHVEHRPRRADDHGGPQRRGAAVAQRRHLQLADDRLARRIAEDAGPDVLGERRWHRRDDEGRRQDAVGHSRGQAAARLPAVGLRLGGRAVATSTPTRCTSPSTRIVKATSRPTSG